MSDAPDNTHGTGGPDLPAADLSGRGMVILSGPSGAGKSTVTRALVRQLGLRLSVSDTTREPRPTEVDGREYRFVEREAFEQRLAADGYLEHAEVFGQFYGTPVEEVEQAGRDGVPLLLEIDVQGGKQVKAKCPAALGVLLLPPDDQVLWDRLSKRGTETEEEIERRFAKAQAEVAAARAAGCYDVEIVNDRLETAIEELVAAIRTWAEAGPGRSQT